MSPILAPVDVPQARQLPEGYTIQRGRPEQAEAMHALIMASLDEGHLLPRTLEDLRRHAERFLVIMSGVSARSSPSDCGPSPASTRWSWKCEAPA